MLFFVGSVTILVMFIPWTDKELLKLPYASLFNMAGVPRRNYEWCRIFITTFRYELRYIYEFAYVIFPCEKGDAPSAFQS